MKLSLSLRLGLLVAATLSLLLAAAAVVIVGHARQTVAEEVDSTLTLTLQLLEAASRFTPAPAATSPGAEGAAAAVRTQIVERVTRLQNVRHLDIAIVGGDGVPPFPPPTLAETPARAAPGWFAALVAPDPVEYRYQLGLPGQRLQVALRPNPVDEIAEAWAESLSTFALLLAFALLIMLFGWVTMHRALRPVTRILEALDSLEHGDHSTRLADFDLPELQRISRRFNLMVETLAEQEAQTRRLSRQALRIREAERAHLARELHDELGQSISAIKALAVTLRRHDGAGPRAREHAATIVAVCDQMYEVVRRLMGELRPATLDTLGLGASLRKLVDDWRQRQTANCTLTLDGDVDRIGAEQAIGVFRIVQECLTNVARHADAAHVDVALAVTPDGEHLRLDVRDDGRGFDSAHTPRGLGQLGIRERVDSMDGSLAIDSAPGRGTQVQVLVPIEAGSARRGGAACDAPDDTRTGSAGTSSSGRPASRTAARPAVAGDAAR